MVFRPDPELYNRSLHEVRSYAERLEHMIQTGPDADEAINNLRKALDLTKTEASMLVVLSDGKTHTKDGILIRLRDGAWDLPEPKVVDVFVCRLRKKVAGTGIVITTLWGSGYFIEDPAPLVALMGGAVVRRAEELVPAEVGRPVGGYGAGHGVIRDRALAYFDTHAVDGVVEVSARELSRGIESTTGGATVIRNLERHGHIEVLRKPRRGGLWKIRVLKEDFA